MIARAERLGGTASVTSTLGEGTRMEAQVPIEPEDPACAVRLAAGPGDPSLNGRSHAPTVSRPGPHGGSYRGPMERPAGTNPVRQLRLVVEADDYAEAVRFFRDVLGLPVEGAYETGEAHVTILDAGRATLELANPAQKRYIDEVEVGRQVAPRMRVAFEVGDSRAVTDQLVEAGARLVASPTETPWRSLNARLDAPAGLHITIFQELDETPG